MDLVFGLILVVIYKKKNTLILRIKLYILLGIMNTSYLKNKKNASLKCYTLYENFILIKIKNTYTCDGLQLL